MELKFNLEDFTDEFTEKIETAAKQWLEEASGEIESQTKQNTRVDTSKTKGSWEHKVDNDNLEARIGSNYENAIWEEYGTGIYAVNGNGRKTPWAYKDRHGKWHKTKGKKPQKALERAYNSKKNIVEDMLKDKLKGI